MHEIHRNLGMAKGMGQMTAETVAELCKDCDCGHSAWLDFFAVIGAGACAVLGAYFVLLLWWTLRSDESAGVGNG